MEVLGLLDTLESMILDSAKIPFSKKMIIDEEKVLGIIDKMRLVVQGGGGFAKGAIAFKPSSTDDAREIVKEQTETGEEAGRGRPHDDSKAVEVLQQAYQMAKEVREGADKYADQVLANIEATSTRILRSIKAGRERLQKSNVPGGEEK